jgi:DNA polymerase-3 subunit epsilon
VLPGYAGFENPGQPVDQEVVRLTGITDDQLLGQRLDDQAVGMWAEAANLIIAHHADFDRRFLERRGSTVPISPAAHGRAPGT